MRLRRLDLVRYGKFTGHSIDFGPKPADGPDFHILFGLNEAGKSTVANGYLDLLYGMEERSRYSFLHDYASMRVDGVLDLDGCERAFARIKQRGNSLLDGAGQPMPEVSIGAHLAGLSRGDYAAMFSLDDETLEAGGRAILDSRGDLGHLLFAAGAGLAHASDALGALDAEADALYRKHAQSTEIAILKKQLGELKAARDAIDTLASTHESLEAERADATRRYGEIVSERAVLTARLNSIDTDCRAIPMLAELDRKLAAVAAMPDGMSPLPTWTGSVPDLIRDDATARARVAANADELMRLDKRIAGIEIDEAILAVSERILGLTDLKARHLSAGLDLPGRRIELQILDNAVSSSLAALGRSSEPDPRLLLLPAATVGAVRAMVEQRSGIATGLRVARDEASTAADALQAARERVGEERAVSAPVRARLAAAVTTARESGNAREIREAGQAIDECGVLWESALFRLHPWTGGPDALAEMSLPRPDDVVLWRGAVAESRTRLAVLAGRISELERTRQSLADRLDAIRGATDLADDRTALALRRSRDEAWGRHRRELLGGTADAFAAVLAEDDMVGAKRLANARELEELRVATDSLSRTESALGAAKAELAGAEAELVSITEDIHRFSQSLAAALGTPDSPERLLDVVEELLQARTAALEAWRSLDLANRRLARARVEEVRLFDDLVASAERVGLAIEGHETMDGLIAVAESFLDRQATLDAQVAEAWRTVTAREDDLASRRRSVEAAERREEEWLEGIAEALAGTWLENGLPAAAVGNVLDQLVTLSKALEDRDALRLRIDKMAVDRDAFQGEVAEVAAMVGSSVEPDEPEQAATRLAARLEHALRSKAAKEALERDLAALEKGRDGLASELAAHDRLKREVLHVFGVGTLEEVVEREDALRERERLLTAIGDLRERFLSEVQAVDLEAARSRLTDVDADRLAIERVEIGQRLLDLDASLHQQLIRQTRAADKLDAIGSDSAVARIDARRRTLLIEIEEKAAKYLRLKLGALAAGNALWEYREQHRSGMMQRASDAFAMMTRGTYTGLSSQPTKAGEVLIAIQRDGRSKVADALSKGTRFQLYLALRLAGYHEFAGLRPTVPFIADDIMETFDEFRSEEVFRLFGEMGKVGQVVYLTHHRHLCEIAKAVVPGAVVHELG